MWKVRCACRYGRLYPRRMEHQILWNLKLGVNKAFSNVKMKYQWNQLCEVIEKVSRSLVIWSRPQAGMIKINTDGSFMEQNGKAGIGGVARDGDGNMIFAYAVPVKCQKHNVVEPLAAKYAAQWIKKANLRCCTIELRL
ncbi:hypothetical protein P3S67_004212 [Capsicum chacoense]